MALLERIKKYQQSSGIVEQYLKKVYHGTYIWNGVVDHYLKKVMLVILVLLSMMAGGHQQSCLRSLIRHRPHKYWHRFGLTHTYTLCKSETHMKALCTCGGRQPKGRVSACRQCIYHSCTFSRPLFTVLSPVLQYMNPARLAIGEQIFLIKTLQTFFNHHYQQQQQQAHTQRRSPPWGVNTQFSGLSLH